MVSNHLGLVLSNEFMTDKYYKLSVKAPDLAKTIQVGQFVNILCAGTEDPLLRRPFSVYNYDRDKGIVEFVYLVKGKGTELMTRFKEGDEAEILGPLGNYYEILPQTKGIAIIGRGVGIASIASLGREAQNRGVSCLAILSGRIPEAIIGEDYLKEFGSQVVSLYDSDGSSSVDNLETILIEAIEAGKVNQIYSCGSNRIGRLVKTLSEKYKLESFISFEENMACGIGTCKGCVCKIQDTYKTVCNDGPIFNVKEVSL